MGSFHQGICSLTYGPKMETRKRVSSWIPRPNKLISRINSVILSDGAAFGVDLLTVEDLEIGEDALVTFDEALSRRRIELKEYRNLLKNVQFILTAELKKTNERFLQKIGALDQAIAGEEDKYETLEDQYDRQDAMLSNKIEQLKTDQQKYMDQIAKLDSRISELRNRDNASLLKTLNKRIEAIKCEIVKENKKHSDFLRATKDRIIKRAPVVDAKSLDTLQQT